MTLEPAALSPSRARLAALELELAGRETDLTALSTELQSLQTSYLAATGDYYAQLIELERAIIDAEVRAGLRPPDWDAQASADSRSAKASAFAEASADESAERSDDHADDGTPGCGNRGAPSADLKKIFRELARTIHPDLALDEPGRWRRHSLMAEANRAYAEQDEDRLRLILHTWHRTPDAVLTDGADDDERVARRIGDLSARLVSVEAEFAEMRRSAIFQLKEKMDVARQAGWDLMAEMVAELQRDLRRARARLVQIGVRS